MEEFRFIVMSIDPMENEDDQLQKYARSATANTVKEAEEKVRKEFEDQNLPVYWIKNI